MVQKTASERHDLGNCHFRSLYSHSKSQVAASWLSKRALKRFKNYHRQEQLIYNRKTKRDKYCYRSYWRDY